MENKVKNNSIFNIYERLDSMKKDLTNTEEQIRLNEGFIEVLKRASDDEKKELKIDGFIKEVEDKNKKMKDQIVWLKKMIDLNSKVIEIYEGNKKKYETFLDITLQAMGFPIADPESDKKKED